MRGKPRRRGAWREIHTGSPPGLLRFRPPDPERGIEKAWRFHHGPKNTQGSSIIDGVADVFQGSHLEVRTSHTGRLLWQRNTSSSLVLATPAEVWTTGTGYVKVRSLRSGREMRRFDLPKSSRVQVVFRDPWLERDGVTFVTTGSGSGHSTTYYRSGRPQTGSGLDIVRVDRTGKALSTAKLASGAVTYDGNRFLLEDGRWLFAFNEQEEEGGKWFTRIVALAPETGATERWIEIEISGKGTGQPPRLCPVAGGLAVGNSEGYGWFTRELPDDDEGIGADSGELPEDSDSDSDE